MFIMQCLQINSELNFWLYLPKAKRRKCNAGWILISLAYFCKEKFFNDFEDLCFASNTFYSFGV